GSPASTVPTYVIARFSATVTFSSPNYNWSQPDTFIIQGNIDETEVLDFNSVIGGVSSVDLRNFRYKLKGKLLSIFPYVYGQSNATTFTATVPFAVGASFPAITVMGGVRNNGVDSTTPGALALTAGSATVNIYRDLSGTAFTASGQKGF